MKKQYHSSKSKTTSKNVKVKFDPKDDSFFKKDVIFEGKPMTIKGVMNPTKSDVTLQERKP